MTAIHTMHEEFKSLLAVVTAEAEPSLHVVLQDIARKSLLLAAASHFESLVVDDIVGFVRETCGDNGELVVSFVRETGLVRRYHTLFDWDKANANKYFALFGSGFAGFIKKQLTIDEDLKEDIRSFMELGAARNNLVHENYATFVLEMTAEEVFNAFERGKSFVGKLRGLRSAYYRERGLAGD